MKKLQAAKQLGSPGGLARIGTSVSATARETLRGGIGDASVERCVVPIKDESANAALSEGLASWQRVLAEAAQSNQKGLPDILKNALIDLFGVGKKAEVSQTKISDWAVGVGELHSIGADVLQSIIIDALAAVNGAVAPQEPTDNSARLRPLDVHQFLALDIKPREMILDPIVPEKGLAMLYAARGTGKTLVALGIGFAAATGTKFLKWTAPKPRGVLLLDGEMPAAALQDRLAKLIDSAPEAELNPENFKVLAADLIEPAGIGNLASAEIQDELEPWLKGVDLVILDNLSSLTSVVRDNDAESWGPIQDWLLKLRRRGMAVLIVHHAGKGGQQRGTSRREDVLDTIISLRRPADYSATEGARFEAHLEKTRGFSGENQIQGEIARIIALPDVIQRLAALGLEPVADTPEEFGTYIKTEIARWGDIIRRSNLKVE